MTKTKLIAVAAACAGALAIAACKPQREAEPVDAVPSSGVSRTPGINTDVSAALVGNNVNIDQGALTDSPPDDLPAAPARKPWTYRHLTMVEGCFIGVLNYDGHEVLVTSGRSNGSSWPVACGAAPLR